MIYCPECNTPLTITQEYRNDYTPPEEVGYCYGCGYVETV